MLKDDTKVQSILNALTIFVGALFLAYCIVYLCVCPSPALAFAVGAELLAFILSLVIIKAGVFAIPKKWIAKIPESVRKLFRLLAGNLNKFKVLTLSVLSFAAVVDFAALCLSLFGQYSAAITLYTWMPVSYWVGLHPAFSLEMLAGALVQNHEFGRAEPLYQEVKAIRISLAGPKSDLASAIYADLGDLSVRSKELAAAEQWYRQSVSLGSHTGRAYTGLATVLRETGQYEESRQWYLKALALRKQIYGEQSKQYNDTLRAYRKLQEISPGPLECHAGCDFLVDSKPSRGKLPGRVY
ncbi:MAG: tetratricopeptide repeat protein [Candidatus Obscuribacterales bacterium]|nr:tetratricopeptide repeat protein [Candidatus Obscuribacterales bacterium]